MPGSATGFGLSIGFADGPVVAIAGEIDLATSPDFAAVLNALIDRGHRNITLDCSELGFIDASGLGILAAAQARLLRTDGEIRIYGASPMAYRVFEITEMVDVLHVERANPNAGEFSKAREIDPIALRATRLAADSARSDAVADTLSRMTALIPEVITACDGVSVTLRRPDYFMTAASSHETFRELDDIQYAVGQGPCLDAATRGVQTHAADLADEHRWEAFTPQARGRGIQSMLSSPLIVNDQPTGALNLYSRTPEAFLRIHHDIATVFAQQTALLLREPDLPTAGEFDDRIYDALASRDVIAQAQGVIMERLGADARAAYATLLQHSVTTSTPLRTHAGDIVAETQQGSAPAHSDGSAND